LVQEEVLEIPVDLEVTIIPLEVVAVVVPVLLDNLLRLGGQVLSVAMVAQVFRFL